MSGPGWTMRQVHVGRWQGTAAAAAAGQVGRRAGPLQGRKELQGSTQILCFGPGPRPRPPLRTCPSPTGCPTWRRAAAACARCCARSYLPDSSRERMRDRVRKEVVAAPSAGAEGYQRRASSTAHWLTGVLRDGPHSGIPLLLQADLGAPEPLALPLQRPDLLTGLRRNTGDE